MLRVPNIVWSLQPITARADISTTPPAAEAVAAETFQDSTQDTVLDTRACEFHLSIRRSPFPGVLPPKCSSIILNEYYCSWSSRNNRER